MGAVLSSSSGVSRKLPRLAYAPRIEANTWVELLQLPSPYSFDEALLLCQVSFDEWLAWIPDYGEICLNVSQFQCADD
ncbi:hypothetical protein [Altericista sp. CCNU0014]|uniref:hypothetical protein n=1 Tax=Altericista sp. CCNU0014 TaxID=3082949 RepID=UPI00384BF049